MVFYVQKVETFCTRAPHILLQMSTGHLKVRLFRFTDIIGYHTEFIAVGYGSIDALQDNVFYSIGPSVLLAYRDLSM